MLLNLFDARQAKKLARTLEKEFAAHGVQLAHSQALDMLARLAGRNGWKDIVRSRSPEVLDTQLLPMELEHIRENEGNDYGEEAALLVHNGFQLRYSANDEAPCDYVRVCDPLGREIAYWVSDEWRDDPEVVMGAILGALVQGVPLAPTKGGLRPSVAALQAEPETAEEECPECKGAEFPGFKLGVPCVRCNGTRFITVSDGASGQQSSRQTQKCPDGLTPDGPACPRCGGPRGPSGVDGGSWVHIQPRPEDTERCQHGVRRPHECKACADETPAEDARRWVAQELAKRNAPRIQDVRFKDLTAVLIDGEYWDVSYVEPEVLACLGDETRDETERDAEDSALLRLVADRGEFRTREHDLCLELVRSLRWDAASGCFVNEEGTTYDFIYAQRFADAWKQKD